MNDPTPKDDLIDLIQSEWVPDKGNPDEFRRGIRRKRSRRRTRSFSLAVGAALGVFCAITFSGVFEDHSNDTRSAQNISQADPEIAAEEDLNDDPYWDSELSASNERDEWPEGYQALAGLVLPNL
jgi:uncharacterized protein YciI